MRAARRAIFRSSTPRCMSQSTRLDSAAESFHVRTTAAASRTARLGRSGARTLAISGMLFSSEMMVARLTFHLFQSRVARSSPTPGACSAR